MRLGAALILLTSLLLSSALHAEDGPVLFGRDVMPILSKSGCNAGSCHGNANGKGGFKLSLRGEDPSLDFETFTKDRHSKRLNIDRPEESFLLRKPAKLISHEGGQRFKPGSPEFETLLKWIAAGAPKDPENTPKLVALECSPQDQILEAPNWEAKITVTAKFSDGSTRDMSRWAVYEPSNLAVSLSPDGLVRANRDAETTIAVRYLNLQSPVRLAFLPSRPDFQWSNPAAFNFIDQHVFNKLRKLKTNPSELCDDHAFLRRVYFDLLGIPPSADEARAFLQDNSPTQEKRARLVDAVFARDEYAEQWALRWSDLLRNEEKVIDQRGVQIFWEWMRASFKADKPLDQFARELVSTFGSTYLEPPSNYYRALRDPATRAEATAQVFLGTRLQCAKCHNHPFEKWTQDDYYRFSALFDGMDYHILANLRGDKFDKHEFYGEQAVFLQDQRGFKDPRTKKPPQPGLLDPAAPPVDPGESRFEALGRWLTAADNPLFARVQANRIWYRLMGAGIVDPVDDFRATNPPSNPGLLDALTQELVKNGFRVKPLVRAIVLSRTYQLSSEPNSTNAEDTINFSHARVRRLTAEQILDAVHLSLGTEPEFRGAEKGTRAGQMRGVRQGRRRDVQSADSTFLKCFGKPARLISSEMERSNETSLAQVFTMTSGRGVDDLLKSSQNRLNQILDQARDNAGQMIDALYWNTLSRPPSSEERVKLSEEIDLAPNKRALLEDIAWSLMNAKEFWFRQ